MHCTRTGSTASLRQTTHVHRTRTGFASLKPQTTRVRRTRYGVYIRQPTEHPRGTYTQQGSHQSIHGSPACGVHATWSTSVKAKSTRVQPARYGAHTSQVRSTHVSARYGVHASRSTDYPRGARVTGFTPVNPRTTPGSKGYIGPITEHTYRSNLF